MTTEIHIHLELKIRHEKPLDKLKLLAATENLIAEQFLAEEADQLIYVNAIEIGQDSVL